MQASHFQLPYIAQINPSSNVCMSQYLYVKIQRMLLYNTAFLPHLDKLHMH